MTRLKKYLAFLLVTAMILVCGAGSGLLPAFAETDPPAEEAVTEETTEAPTEEPTEATEPAEPKQEETQAPAVQETEPAEIVEEVPVEEDLTYREIKATTIAEPLYYVDKNKKQHRTKAHQMLVQFWDALMGRTASVEENDLGLKVTVSGVMPEDVTAEFRVIAFDEEPIFTEEGVASGELTLRDAAGQIYVPAEPVVVTIKGKALKREIKDDSALLLYSYQLAPKRAEKYAKKYKKSFYAANVDVYKSDTVDDSLLNYKPYKKSKKYKKGADAVRYTEVETGLACGKNTVSFDYDYKNNKTGTVNLVLTAQQAERTLNATSGKAAVTVTGNLDKDVTLKVSEVDPKSADYKDYVEQTAQTLGTEASAFDFARAFDIKLIDPETGEEFHPDDDMQVSIKLKDEEINDESKVKVVHFDESTAAQDEAADNAKAGKDGLKGQSAKSGKHRNLGKPERVKSHTEGQTVEFTAEGFSVYVLVFSTEVEGEVHEYSMSDESILLSDLADALDLSINIEEDVDTVTFATEEESSQMILQPLNDAGDPAGPDEPIEDWQLTKTEYFYSGVTLNLVLKDESGIISIHVALGVTITANSDKKDYDGTPLENDGYSVVGLAEGDRIPEGTITVDGSRTEAGESPNTVAGTEDFKILNSEGQDVKGLYDIKFVPGTLTVNKASITVTANSDVFGYDGQNHTVEGVTCSDKNLTVTGVTATRTEKDPGMYDVECVPGDEVKVEKDGVDVTANYTIKYANGLLTINDLNNPYIKKTMKDDEFNGDIASYEIVVNPNEAELNEGNNLTVKDTFSDNQTIDYGSISISPADAGVAYDYSGYTGTFTIPDKKKVTITYNTRITKDKPGKEGKPVKAGEEAAFNNEAMLGKMEGGRFISASKDSTVSSKTITPTGSDITGTSEDYFIKLFVYGQDKNGQGHMEQGLPGAEFQLLDSNMRPMTYIDTSDPDKPETKNITFTTGNGGIVLIQSDSSRNLTIKKNTVYYLLMTKAPYEKNGDEYTYYQKDNTPYSFLITDTPSYQYGNIYSYFNGDTLKVRCYAEAAGVNVTKVFSGSYTPSKEEQNAIEFVLEKQSHETGLWEEVERHAYSEFSYGSKNFDAGRKYPLEDATWYRVIEENAEIANIDLEASTSVSYQKNGVPVQEDGNEFLVNPDSESFSFNLVINNEYVDHKLSIVKYDEDTGETISGAQFQVFTADGTAVDGAVYTTPADGKIDIRKAYGNDKEFSVDKLYYAQEIHEPSGYLMPSDPERFYFYFSETSKTVPGDPPSGAKVIDLAKSYSTETVANQKATVDVPVTVTWSKWSQKNQQWEEDTAWPENVTSVTLKLRQKINGEWSDVLGQTTREPRYVTLTSENNYNNRDYIGLPALTRDGEPIEYAVVETAVNVKNVGNKVDEYAFPCRISNSGWYVLNNKEGISVNAQKKWYDLEEQQIMNTSEEPDVRFKLYRTTVEKEGSLEGLTEEELRTFLNNAEQVKVADNLIVKNPNNSSAAGSVWTKKVDNLEKTDKNNHPYYYYALETVPDNNEVKYTIHPAGSAEGSLRTLEFANRQIPTTIRLSLRNEEDGSNQFVKTYGDNDPDFGISAAILDETLDVKVTPEEGATGNYIATVTKKYEAAGGTAGEPEGTVEFRVYLKDDQGREVDDSQRLDTYQGQELENGKRLNIGTYDICFDVIRNTGFTVQPDTTGKLTVNKKNATVTAGATKGYGENDPVLVQEEGVLEGDGPLKYDVIRDPGEEVGSYPITLEGETEQGNYHVTYVDGALEITQASVTVSVDTNYTKEYGDEDPDYEVHFSKEGVENVIEFSISREEGEDVGEYAIVLSGSKDQGNYSVTFENGKLTITKARLTITVQNAEKTYGTDDPEWDLVYDGLKNGDEEDVVECAVTRAEGEDVGTYALNLTAFYPDESLPEEDQRPHNYEVDCVDGTLEIVKAELVIIPDDIMKAVGETTDPQLTAHFQGDKAGDIGEGTASPGTQSGQTGNVKWTYPVKIAGGTENLVFELYRQSGTEIGTYQIFSVKGEGGTETLKNYTITYETGTFSISSQVNVDVSREMNDPVDSLADPAYEYVATLDLTNPGMSDYTEDGFVVDENNHHISTKTFILGGKHDSKISLKIPVHAALTIEQTGMAQPEESEDSVTYYADDYDTELTANGVLQSGTTYTNPNVDVYVPVIYTQNRICLNAEAWTYVGDNRDSIASPSGYIGINRDSNGESIPLAIDDDFVLGTADAQGFEDRVGYRLPEDKYYAYNSEKNAVYKVEDGQESKTADGIRAVKFNTDNHIWEYSSNGSDFAPVPEGGKLVLVYEAKLVCQVRHEGLDPQKFYNLRSALDYIKETTNFTKTKEEEVTITDPETGTQTTQTVAMKTVEGTIEMLIKSYRMPEGDSLTIPAGGKNESYEITLTTATRANGYTGDNSTASIARKSNFTAGAMFINNGTFTLDNVIIDGKDISSTTAMITNAGTKANLTVNANAILQNAKGINGGAVNMSNGTVTIHGALKNNRANNGAGVYAAGGTLNIGSAQGLITGNHATNGGVVYMASGDAAHVLNITGTIGGSSENQKNTATNGGALYICQNGTVNLDKPSTVGKIIGNSADKGGAVFMTGGTMNIQNSSNEITGNTAADSGGAFYMEGGTVNIPRGSLKNNVAAKDGGLMYGKGGDFNVTGGTVSGNKATAGNGGAICYEGSGSVTLKGGTYGGNQAINGNGGVVHQSSGTVNISATLNSTNNNNIASCGDVVSIAGGTTNFSGGSIKGNRTAEYGAVYVYGDSPTLNFSGNTQITDNTYLAEPSAEQEPRNVYLAVDSNAVINTPGLGASANIGIYVPDADNMWNKHGDICTQFGAYTEDKNLGSFKNDRSQKWDSDSTKDKIVAYGHDNKLMWSQPITFNVKKIDGALPPKSDAETIHGNTMYYPTDKNNDDMYALVTELYNSKYSGKVPSGYVYAYSYIANEGFSKYLTRITWDSNHQVWVYNQNGGESVSNSLSSANTIIPVMSVYYSKGSYISITNNYDKTLTIDPMTVWTHNVVGESYGYVVAKDYVTQPTLSPITGQDLILGPGQTTSIKLLFPGAVGQNWSITGVFQNTTDRAIPYVRTDGTNRIEGSLGQPEQEGGDPPGRVVDGSVHFTLSGTLSTNAGTTYEIIFGAETNICKAVGYKSDGTTIVKKAFPTLKKAYSYIKNCPDNGGNYLLTPDTDAEGNPEESMVKGGRIEMLVDYQQPYNDILEIANADDGYNITLTTADKNDPDPALRFKGSGDKATISRSSGDIGSAVTSIIADGSQKYKDADCSPDPQTGVQNCKTKLNIEKIIFDGKALGQGGEGGAVKTTNTIVNIKDSKFQGYTAARGGAVFVKWGKLTVDTCDFDNCKTLSTEDKTGGGAIWTTVQVLTIKGTCSFTECQCLETTNGKAQGGAIFHDIVRDYKPIWNGSKETFPQYFAKDAHMNLSGCSFDHCYSAQGSGGTIETGARYIDITGCTFNGSSARKNNGNGGALNALADGLLEAFNYDSHLNVTSTTFQNCEAPKGASKGGVIKTNILETKLENCTFKNTSANGQGGAVYIDNTSATKCEILGCTFENCKAGSDSGAVYVPAKQLIIRESPLKTENGGYTTFKNCSAPKYGGVNQTANNAGTQVDVIYTDFESCSSNTNLGGALFANAQKLSIGTMEVTNEGGTVTETVTGPVTFKTCNAGTDGGAVYHAGTQTASEILSGCTFEGCTAGSSGGAAYLNNANLTISDTTVKDCTAVKDGGGMFISPLNTSSSPARITDCTFSGNSATATSSRGGSLFINKGAVSIDKDKPESEPTISDSIAASGGGIYNQDTNGILQLHEGVKIKDCVAKGSGGGLYAAAQAQMSGATIENCHAVTSGGGIYHTGKLCLYSGQVKGCAAKQGGGICSAGNLEMSKPSDSSGEFSIQNCKAREVSITAENKANVTEIAAEDNLGGGIYNRSGELKMLSADGSISNCSAYDGAGIYVFDGSLDVNEGSIRKNPADNNGGGVFVAGGTVWMRGGTIGDAETTANGNTAVKGAGVFVDDNQSMYFSGGKITYNNATVEGGGIAVGGIGAKLYFGGSPVVRNNTMLGDVKCNVYLDRDWNGIIRTGSTSTTGALGAAAYIGVYASDAEDPRHGQYGKPFGTYDTESNLDRFSNDRRFCGGVKSGTTDKQIIWANYVCRITDANGKTLCTDEAGTVPAVYTVLENNGTKETTSAFGMLAMANTPALYNQGGGQYINYSGENGGYQIQMLVQDYQIKTRIGRDKTAHSNRQKIVLTTGYEEDEFGFYYTGDQAHPCATITKGDTFTNQMFTIRDDLILSDIILDQDGENKPAIDAGGIICLKDSGTLTINDNTTLRNGKTTNVDGGGAISVYNDNCRVTMNGGLIEHCTAAGCNGGAVALKAQKSTFDMKGGTIKDCVAKKGGAVYLANSNNNCILNMSGGIITECNATQSGGGISVEGKNSRIYFSGTARVMGNTCNISVAPEKACNVQLDPASTDVIRAYDLLYDPDPEKSAEIGVYTPDENNQYKNYGDINKPFGTWNVVWPDNASPYCFVNDRNDQWRGAKKEQSDQRIYWEGNYVLNINTEVVSDLAHDKEVDFTYRVTIDNPDIDGQYGVLNFTDGVAETTMKDGENRAAVGLSSIVLLEKTYTVEVIWKTGEGDAKDGDYKTFAQKGSDDPIESTTITGVFGDSDSTVHSVKFTHSRWTEDLSINKTVVSSDASSASEDFNFGFELGDPTISGKNYAYVIKDKDDVEKGSGNISITNGKADSFPSLRDGYTITISGLPTTLSYKVTEKLTEQQKALTQTTVSVDGEEAVPSLEAEGTIGKVDSAGGEASNKNKVVFTNTFLDYVCKIVIKNTRGLLYFEDHSPAVFTTLESAFAKLNEGGLCYKSGTVYNEGAFQIEMLVPQYTMTGQALLNYQNLTGKENVVFLSTALPTDQDYFPYNKGQSQGDNIARVSRGSDFNNNSMILNHGDLTLDKIKLDGANVEVTRTGGVDGGIIQVEKMDDMDDHNAKLTLNNSNATISNSNVTEGRGGAIYLGAGTSLVMNGNITNCKAPSGGGVYAKDGFDTIGVAGTISGCTATGGSGGAIYAGVHSPSGDSISVKDAGQLTGNRAVKADGVVVSGNGGAIASHANVSIAGHIGGAGSGKGNIADNEGGGIYMYTGAEFRMNKGEITGNTAGASTDGTVTNGGNGGGLVVNGLTEITGGTFSGNQALKLTGDDTTGNGGAIYATGNATVNVTKRLTGPEIHFVGNSAAKGGAIYDATTVTIDGGNAPAVWGVSMTGNSADESGGAVYVAANSQFTMKGRSVIGSTGDGTANSSNSSPEGADDTANSNSSPKGAIATASSARLMFSGNAVVRGNVYGGKARNVYLGDDSNDIIWTDGLGDSAEIGVYVCDAQEEAHGIAARNFGTYTGTSSSNNKLHKFVNDRREPGAPLVGAKGTLKPGSNYSYIMWEGKPLTINVRRLETLDSEHPETSYYDRSAPSQDASFELYVGHDVEGTTTWTKIWTGRSEANGELKILWGPEDGNNKCAFTKDTTYKLVQTAVKHTSSTPQQRDTVRPEGCWTITIGAGNEVTWTTVPSAENKNRTIDIEPKNAHLGDEFRLYNDVEPVVIFNGNGGILNGETSAVDGDGHPIVHKSVVKFLANEDSGWSRTYTITENNPTKPSARFLNWSNQEGEPDDPEAQGYYGCNKGAQRLFARTTDNDDLTLYAHFLQVVCKITDGNDNLLYRNGDPAVFTKLEDCFDAYNTEVFTDENGKKQRETKIKMLVETYDLTKPLTLERGKSLILTTADKADNDIDGYPGPYDAKDEQPKVCTITRAFMKGSDSDKSMITDKFSLSLSHIILDGGTEAEGYDPDNPVTTNGGIISIEGNSSSLTLSSEAALRNSSTTRNGGAVYVNANTTFTINGGVITNCDAAGGGGVYVDAGGKLVLSNATIKDNTASGHGAGIYLAKSQDPDKKGSTLNISGKQTFAENYDSIDGEPTRVDIYLEEGGTEEHHNPASIVVTGNLSGQSGSIYVWAANQYHYEQLMPFAKLDDSKKFSKSNKTKVFRNARPDSDTLNATDGYLYGVINDDMPGYICWNGNLGGRKVILRKVAAGSFDSLEGAEFEIRRGSSSGALVDGTDVNGDDATTFVSGSSGVFFIGELSYGVTYYVKETAAPANYGSNRGNVYQLTVDKNGVVTTGKELSAQ